MLLKEAAHQLQYGEFVAPVVFAVIHDTTAACKSRGGSDYFCTVFVRDPTDNDGGVGKVDARCFAGAVASLPRTTDDSLQQPTDPSAGDIIKLTNVKVQKYNLRPQLVLRMPPPSRKDRNGTWSLYRRHPPPDATHEVPYASSTVAGSYCCSEDDVRKLAQLRGALDKMDKEAEAAAVAAATAATLQGAQPAALNQAELQPSAHNQHQQQLAANQAAHRMLHQAAARCVAAADPDHQPLLKIERLVQSCTSPSRLLVDLICKVLAVDYRDQGHAVLFVWDATDALSCQRSCNIPPCVHVAPNQMGKDLDLPTWEHPQQHALPLVPAPAPHPSTGEHSSPQPCWKGGVDVVPASAMPRLGSAVPLVLPYSTASPPLRCSHSNAPITAGMEVKLRRVSPCIVQGQPQLMFVKGSFCTTREAERPEEGDGGRQQGGAGSGKRGHTEAQQSNKQARTSKQGISKTYASRKSEQQQEWEQLDMELQQQGCQPQGQRPDATFGASRQGTHLATRVLLPPGHTGPPPIRGTVRDTLMAFMDEEHQPTSAPQQASLDGSNTLQGSAGERWHDVPPRIVRARVSAHYPHTSQTTVLPRSEIPGSEDVSNQLGRSEPVRMLKVLVEDATGQLDAVMVGADVEEFFAPLAPPEHWGPDSDQGTGLPDKMECALQWLETGAPCGGIGFAAHNSHDKHSGAGQPTDEQSHAPNGRSEEGPSVRGNPSSSSSRGRSGRQQRDRGSRGGGRGRSEDESEQGQQQDTRQQQQQPWCELLVHPMAWDARMHGMQFYRLLHTRLCSECVSGGAQ